jgi:hypothetical protein
MRWFILSLLSLLLSSCSSGKKEPEFTSMEKRMLGGKMNKKSPYEKEFNTNKDSSGKYFTGKGFKTGDYRGAGDYKTKEFGQGGKMSRYGNQTATFGRQESRMGKTTFATKENRMGGQSARMGSQQFNGASNEFKTSSFQPASKSLEKDLKPRIYGESSATSKPAYTEEEISNLINR